MGKCSITGKSFLNGNRVSHSNIRTKHKQHVNIQKKRVYDIQSKSWKKIKTSVKALRTWYKID